MTKGMEIHFLSDVLIAFALLDLKVPDVSVQPRREDV